MMAFTTSAWRRSQSAKLSATRANIPNGQVGQAFLPGRDYRTERGSAGCQAQLANGNIQNMIVHWKTLDLLEVAVDYLVDCSSIRSTVYLTRKLTLASGATAHGSVLSVCLIALMFDGSLVALELN
jgi:hypothetical protein